VIRLKAKPVIQVSASLILSAAMLACTSPVGHLPPGWDCIGTFDEYAYQEVSSFGREWSPLATRRYVPDERS
jgi:hypothetical protein